MCIIKVEVMGYLRVVWLCRRNGQRHLVLSAPAAPPFTSPPAPCALLQGVQPGGLPAI